MGQSAQKQAQMFHDTVGVTGVVITKLDGTAKGGGALSACAVTGAPIKFIGVGEKLDALEEFKAKNFVGRLLGMGDIEALLEKAQLAISEDEAQDLQQKMLKGDFSLLDMYQQMEAVKKMGPLSKVMEMVPGLSGKVPKEALSAQQENLEQWKYVLASMTREELESPEVMNKNRVARVAAGSGQPERVVRDLIKQHRKSKKMMKMFKGKGGSEKQMKKLMKRMGQGGMPNMKF